MNRNWPLMNQYAATWLVTPDITSNRDLAFTSYKEVARGAVASLALLKHVEQHIENRQSMAGIWCGSWLLLIVEDFDTLTSDRVTGPLVKASVAWIEAHGERVGVKLARHVMNPTR